MTSIQFYWQCPKCDRRMPIEQVVHNCDADGTAVKRAIEYVWYDSSKFQAEPDMEYTCPPCWVKKP